MMNESIPSGPSVMSQRPGLSQFAELSLLWCGAIKDGLKVNRVYITLRYISHSVYFGLFLFPGLVTLT